MKIKTKVKSSFAISPRTIISFNANELLEVGDKDLTEANLNRLVDLELATLVIDNPDKIIISEVVEVTKEAVSYKDIEDKDELYAYALDQHDIKLDKRKNLDAMVEQLENKLKGDK